MSTRWCWDTHFLAHPGAGPEHPTPAYTMVSAILARQFYQIQLLGREHQQTPISVSPRMAAAPLSTPLVLDAWRAALQSHPDRGWVECLLTEMHEGFCIGLIQTPQCQSTQGNALSATDKAEVVSSFLTLQCEKGRMLGPLPPEESTGVITSRMAVIPKKVAGKWRLIVDLSSPHNGHSVNDNLRRHLSHVSYPSTDDAAMLMHFLGLGAPIAKVDVQDAYRLMPIHPADRRFLGVSWQGSVYVDCQLPFGLATALAIFNALEEALEWILGSRGVKYIIHYLDDFLLLGHPNSEECAAPLSTTLSTCRDLGVPLAADKVEGPAPVLTFLGIEFNTVAMSLALPMTSWLLSVRYSRGSRVQYVSAICTNYNPNWALKPSVSSAPPEEGLHQQPLPSGKSHEAGSSPAAQQCSTP